MATRNSSQRPGYIPTRVIDVGTEKNPSMRLIETTKDVHGDYIAFSHCWGILTKEERFCTHRNNVTDLKKSIPYDRLPRNFQDAVQVTRALGLSYLWIDSLCIVQDDKDDWEREAGRMEDVFSSAYCTIAASSAKSSLTGFLHEREPRASATVQTSKGPLYLAEAIDDFQADVEKSVLNTRGWVLQERALSRRIIHFSSNQIYWECGKGIFCETLAQPRR